MVLFHFLVGERCLRFLRGLRTLRGSVVVAGFAHEGGGGAAVAVELVADGPGGAVGHAVEAARAARGVDVAAHYFYALCPAVVFASAAADTFVGVNLDVHDRTFLHEAEYCAERTETGAE